MRILSRFYRFSKRFSLFALILATAPEVSNRSGCDEEATFTTTSSTARSGATKPAKPMKTVRSAAVSEALPPGSCVEAGGCQGGGRVVAAGTTTP